MILWSNLITKSNFWKKVYLSLWFPRDKCPSWHGGTVLSRKIGWSRKITWDLLLVALHRARPHLPMPCENSATNWNPWVTVNVPPTASFSWCLVCDGTVDSSGESDITPRSQGCPESFWCSLLFSSFSHLPLLPNSCLQLPPRRSLNSLF